MQLGLQDRHLRRRVSRWESRPVGQGEPLDPENAAEALCVSVVEMDPAITPPRTAPALVGTVWNGPASTRLVAVAAAGPFHTAEDLPRADGL